jgi:Uma2 family endonuclease
MSTISTKPFTPTPFTPPAVLPLEDGDHMDVAEFIRRWEALPEEWRAEHKRVELIEGVVRMPPVSGGSHAQPQFDFLAFLGIYAWATPGELGCAPASLILDEKNMPEPDAFLAIHPKNGGRVKLDEKGYVIGIPELLVEIASSSVSYDLHTKKELYRQHGGKEYVVWRAKEKAIDWFTLQDGAFQQKTLIEGIYKSEQFPGLWLAANALIAGDYGQVNQTLQQGIATPEHHAFLERLQSQASK